MIQKMSHRQLSTVLGSPLCHTADGPEEGGPWICNRHYSLEISQHPLSTKMCSFSDKDWWPLVPAEVAKDNAIILDEKYILLTFPHFTYSCTQLTIPGPPSSNVDVNFFLVTVDRASLGLSEWEMGGGSR
ncbi:hypothetical protein K439DRAFT_1620399 [Ramaria rubella]|nr:hypothetical protein K439DRAFT_1620399 [Ramaria rubella]